MYVLPQEIEVWYILPAIRKELAKLLTNKHSMTFEKTGKILGISKSAVSQYLSKKRGSKFIIPDKLKKELEKSAEVISKDPDKAVSEIQRMLKIIKQTKCSCSLCKKYNPEIIKFCNCNNLY